MLFPILYNLDVPYIILNDTEQEYVLQKNYYYHKIHVNYIDLLDNEDKLKCIHYVVSIHKLSSSDLKKIKNNIDIDQSLLKLYQVYIKENNNIKYNINHSKVLHTIDNTYPDGYFQWSSEFYKKKYKSLTPKEVKTIVSWKSDSMNINSYSYMNISLYYTIMYQLCNTPPVDKQTEIVGFKINLISYENEKIIHYMRIHESKKIKKYYLVILEEKENKNKIIIHPGLILKKFNNFTFIYYPGSILKFDHSNNQHLYPNNVEMKKNEIYFGNMNGIFDDYATVK